MAKEPCCRFMEGLRSLRPMDLLVATVAGILSGIIYIFLFPGTAISTLMHQVLHLPGPGVGIGFIIGPYLILSGLIVWTYIRKPVVAFYVIVISATLQVYVGPMMGPTVLGNEAIPYMILAAFILGALVDGLAFALRDLKDWEGYPITSLVANQLFLIIYWLVVFPPVKGWPTMKGAVIMSGVSVIGALMIGALPPIIYSIGTSMDGSAGGMLEEPRRHPDEEE